MSALLWSFGGALGRFAQIPDTAAMVFWRSLFGTLFLIFFMMAYYGPRKTVDQFFRLGAYGLLVALCFALASSWFIISLQYTTVANILLIQAATPLIAAVLGWLLFGDKISGTSIFAICAVLVGFAIMFLDLSFLQATSANQAVQTSTDTLRNMVGVVLAIAIAIFFATATVVTRHASDVQMMPAVCIATLVATVGATFFVESFSAPTNKLAWLFLFGTANLGLGLAFFTMGARLIPAVFVALLGTLEPVLGPIWVWLIHDEELSMQAIVGGAVVLGAIYTKIMIDWWTERGDDDAALQQS